MKKSVLFTLITMGIISASAQPATDSIIKPVITVTKDDRIDVLGKKMAEYNESLSTKIHLEKGYRLMLLSTTDRTQAIQVRSKLLQQFPEQSVYMSFQSPYIKLKFGDFLEQEQANDMKKELTKAKIVTGNIYVVPEMVEVKPDKTKAANIDE